MLHVHCGDTSATTLRKSGVLGDVIVWCDPLCEGPTPGGTTKAEWQELRARNINESTGGGLPEDQALEFLKAQERKLESFHEQDEVVLWFDACLFDQIILIRQLDWFTRQNRGNTKLSLICIAAFPGFNRFRGLGELNSQQLSSLLPIRHIVAQA